MTRNHFVVIETPDGRCGVVERMVHAATHLLPETPYGFRVLVTKAGSKLFSREIWEPGTHGLEQARTLLDAAMRATGLGPIAPEDPRMTAWALLSSVSPGTPGPRTPHAATQPESGLDPTDAEGETHGGSGPGAPAPRV
jgi:hypothetical protein